MRAIAFQKKHMDEMLGWLKARNAYLPSPSEMPKVGFIVPGVACGFIRRVEGGYGQLDGLTTNPEASSEARHIGIDLVVSKIMLKARKMGIKSLIATSQDVGTIERSHKHGFEKCTLTVLVADLNNRR